MANAAQITMTPEDFFAWDPGDEERYELVDGFPVKMMTGASQVHDVIVTNIIASLRNQLRGSGCRPTTDDIALRTKINSVRRPDVMVNCGDPTADSYEAHEPRLVVEVLSPSNSGLPWQRKLEEYRQHAALLYILLIEPGSVGATLLTRKGDAWPSVDYDSLDAIIHLPDLKCQLPMADIYEDLDPKPANEPPSC